MFDLSTSLMSSLETSRSRGPHENCITQQKRGGRKITVWTRNWLVRRAKRPWRLATKSSGDIQLSPKATPAHIQQIVFLMSRCSKIQIRENTTSKIKLQFPGLNGFDDGQGDGDRVLPSVRLCYDEEWAVPPWLVLTVELLQKRSQVDRCLHISPHEEALVLHVAESCAHRVVLHFSFGGRIKLIWRHRNAAFFIGQRTHHKEEISFLQPCRFPRLQVGVQRPDLLEISDPHARSTLPPRKHESELRCGFWFVDCAC